MTPQQLLSHLRSRGVVLWNEGESIRFRAPKGTLTDDLRRQLKDRKDEIRRLLQQGRVEAQQQAVPRRIPRTGELPLSPYQERIWFLDQLETGGPTYNVHTVLRLRGNLNIPALSESINRTVARHEVLRMSCQTVDGSPRLVIHPELHIDLPVIDLQSVSPASREREAKIIAEVESRRSFDLANDPLLRPVLLQLQDDEYWLILTLHHFMIDGISMRLLLEELAQHYAARLRGEDCVLPRPNLEFLDFAHWQREELDGPDMRRAAEYWLKQLAGAPDALNIPADRPRPPVQSFEGALEPFELPRELSDKLQALSRREGVTLFMTLLAGFQALLHRYTQQTDLVVGTATSNRSHAEFDEVIGPFTNTLLLRVDSSGDPTFRELLRRVRDVSLDAFSNQGIPFVRLVEMLHPRRDPSRNLLFQALFVLHQGSLADTLDLPGVELERVAVDPGTARVDIGLEMTQNDDGLSGFLEYNTDIFNRDTIVRMIGHFETLLAGAIADADQKLSALPLLTDAERDALVNEWSRGPEPDSLEPACVHELIERQAASTPDAQALVYRGGSMTYRELNGRANQLARRLRALGVGPETMVALSMRRSADMIVGLLGIWKAGGVYVPVDPEYPEARLTHLLRDSRAAVIVTQESLVERLPADSAAIVRIDADWPEIERESADDLENAVSGENAAYVIYTSGSTGLPKGVVVCHREISEYVREAAQFLEITPDDCMLQFFSINFDPSLEQILEPLICGARVALRGDDIWLPEEFHGYFAEYGVTIAELTPALWLPLVRYWHDHPECCAETTLRLVVIGGDFPPPESIALWEKSAIRHVRLVNMYGPTETTIAATCYDISAHRDDVLGAERIPIGRPLPGRRAYILDPQGSLVPAGIPGELYLGGAGLARGYLNQPELTRERFVADHVSGLPGARLYRTGDLARWRGDGEIEMLGRLDHQVKIRGFRVELGEVEAAVLRQPGVAEAVVVAHGAQAADKRLVAYVVFRPGKSRSIGDLRAELRHDLADHMVPSAFVVLDRLPLSPNGKLDREALPEPDASRPDWSQPYEGPRTPVEEMLAEVWADVLHLDRVSIHDDFFELGGHSLLATQVVSRLREAFDLDISLRLMFERPTIADLSLGILELLAARLPGAALDAIL